MIRINVAPELKYKSDQAEILRIGAVVLVFCGLGYFAPVYYAGLRNDEANEIRSKIEEKKGQLGKLKLDVEKVKSLQVRLAELKSRADRIRSLSTGRKKPVLLLDILQQQHLERMWFTALSMSGTSVMVNGFALDHAVIAEYVRRLKVHSGSDQGESVDLKNFVPPFLQGEGVREDLEKSDSVQPIQLSNVRLVRSTSGTQENVLVQSFQLSFSANVK